MNSRVFCQSIITRQRRWVVCGLLSLLVFYFFISFTPTFTLVVDPPPALPPALPDLDQPPTYKRLREWETNLPQHNLDLPFPEGRTGRYVFFKNQIIGLGWNNELNEV